MARPAELHPGDLLTLAQPVVDALERPGRRVVPLTHDRDRSGPVEVVVQVAIVVTELERPAPERRCDYRAIALILYVAASRSQRKGGRDGTEDNRRTGRRH